MGDRALGGPKWADDEMETSRAARGCGVECRLMMPELVAAERLLSLPRSPGGQVASMVYQQSRSALGSTWVRRLRCRGRR